MSGFDLNMFQELAQKCAEKISGLTFNSKDELEKKLFEVLTPLLKKCHVLTREEFEIQSKILARTQAKLEQLEKKLNQLSQTAYKKPVNATLPLDILKK